MVTIIGLCMSSDMKSLPVTLISSVCHPTCSTSFSADMGPLIAKQDTPYRKSLEPGLKLAMTMRHLASGDRYASMKFDFRVPHNTMSVCVREVCQALIDEYNDECIQCPTTAAEWREISEAFGRRWNVPHACAAFDGKHVAGRRPRNSGSLYFNYKSFFSIMLMGLVDSDYKFLWIDVGGCGHMSDAQLFNASELKECLEDNSIGFPLADPLPNDDRPTPYYILGDDAFGLRTYLMKPYEQRQLKEQRVFNCRLLRGRRIVAQRWQILLTTMQHDTSASWRSVGRSSSLRGNTTLRPLLSSWRPASICTF